MGIGEAYIVATFCATFVPKIAFAATHLTLLRIIFFIECDGCLCGTIFFPIFAMRSREGIHTHTHHHYLSSMLNLILFGPPGSGKGTQAERLVDKYNLFHISTGDMFRNEMANGTSLGLEAKAYADKGNLVPDELTVRMLQSHLDAHAHVKGYILDGFPRTVAQAQALDVMFAQRGQAVTALLALQVDEDEIVGRLVKRGNESGRVDDQDETVIRNRMHVYKSQTQVVADYYAAHHKSHFIDGMGSIAEVETRLDAIVDTFV